MLLKALGWDNAQILERFGEYESMRATLEKDHTTGQDDALLDIYRKLRPGEPPTREAAQTLLENLYFNPKRYDLAKVGRYKVNKKLGVELPLVAGHADRGRHRRDDRLHRQAARRRDETSASGRASSRPTTSTTSATVACAPSASSSRTRSALGLARMERVVRERMTTQDVEAITPQTLINIRPVVASIKEFFGTSPAVAVHGPDQPAGGSDPQAPSVRARPGWSVP